MIHVSTAERAERSEASEAKGQNSQQKVCPNDSTKERGGGTKKNTEVCKPPSPIESSSSHIHGVAEYRSSRKGTKIVYVYFRVGGLLRGCFHFKMCISWPGRGVGGVTEERNGQKL